MPLGRHSHYGDGKYITRIVKRTELGSGENRGTNEFLQKICEIDGVMFEEIKVTMEEFKGN